jgi:hypothetical protein
MMKTLYVALALVPLLTLASPALGIDDEFTRKSLTGLRGVYVVVEDFDADRQRAGFDQRTFLTDVEVRLRTAGIPVLTLEERGAAPGKPVLYLNVNALHDQPGEANAYSIMLEVLQRVTLASGQTTTAITWSVSGMGMETFEQVRGRVRDKVDEFINAWLSVNPK